MEAIERYASFNWLGGDEETASQGWQEHSWQETRHGEWPSWDSPYTSVPEETWHRSSSYTGAHEEEEKEDDEDDYVPSPGAETDSDALSDMEEGKHIRFSYADFAGWVNRGGGLGRLVALINER